MTTGFRDRMRAGEHLVGTFVKTPVIEVIEILAKSGLDFLCLDAEHAPWDRARLDACLAIGRALGLPMLVRVPAARPELILGALDSGATGIVVPHVDNTARAQEIARAARFGLGGRGFAGATRWADWGGVSMKDLLQRAQDETVVIAQIEEPAGVAAAASIAATEGIDGLFIGPSDLTVAYGHTDPANPQITAAYETVGAACRDAGTAFITWSPTPEVARTRMNEAGVTMVLVASELTWMLNGARAAAKELK